MINVIVWQTENLAQITIPLCFSSADIFWQQYKYFINHRQGRDEWNGTEYSGTEHIIQNYISLHKTGCYCQRDALEQNQMEHSK